MAFFGEGAFRFLEELEENNERAWFEANKDRYERDVREPARELIRALAPRIAPLTPHFRADDRKVGGSLMRIFRDTRFSKDKRPYKTNIGIQLRHEGGKDVHAPGVYVHIAADGCFLGLGLWMPEAPLLEAIRQRLVADPDGYTAIVEAPSFTAVYARDHHGESLKRPPRGYPADHPLVEELKRKSHLASADLTREDVLADDLDRRLITRLEAGLPYLRFLCDAVGVEP